MCELSPLEKSLSDLVDKDTNVEQEVWNKARRCELMVELQVLHEAK